MVKILNFVQKPCNSHKKSTYAETTKLHNVFRSKNCIFSCFESSEPFQKGIKGNVSHKIKKTVKQFLTLFCMYY